MSVWGLLHELAGMVREAGLTVASDALAHVAVGTETLQAGQEVVARWQLRKVCGAQRKRQAAARSLLPSHLMVTSALGWLASVSVTDAASALSIITTPGDSVAWGVSQGACSGWRLGGCPRPGLVCGQARRRSEPGTPGAQQQQQGCTTASAPAPPPTCAASVECSSLLGVMEMSTARGRAVGSHLHGGPARGTAAPAAALVQAVGAKHQDSGCVLEPPTQHPACAWGIHGSLTCPSRRDRQRWHQGWPPS